MQKPIYLGSKSPRRAQILKQAGFEFKVIVSDEEELIDESIPKVEIPEFLAKQKAAFIQPKIEVDDYVLITADTIVLLNDTIIGKPRNLSEAHDFIEALSGQTHQVISGVCINTKNSSVSFSDIAEVTFKTLTKKEIEFYINNYEVLDKAGAYAIQEWIGLIGITAIKGSYYTIMGLPIHKVYDELKKF